MRSRMQFTSLIILAEEKRRLEDASSLLFSYSIRRTYLIVFTFFDWQFYYHKVVTDLCTSLSIPIF